MTSMFALAVLAAPTALVAMALLARIFPGPRPRRVLVTAQGVSLAVLATAVAAAAVVAMHGAATSPLLGWDGIGFSIRLDALSVTMFLLVAFVGAVVIRFSHSYLDGDARQGAFTGRLCLTLAAVLLLVLAGNLTQLVGAWIATSLALHRLLTFYPERSRARLAARKKFVTARLGDGCLVIAAGLLVHAFGTTDIATLLHAAASATSVPAGVATAATLLAAAALLKSAQFPAHGWLPEVMETPTPVSALLHAGIINAGGFLVVRLADVMTLWTPALHLLAIVGGFTALFGAVVMLTQTSIKVSLAWSTVSQMGFLLLQCGLGLFPLAVLHIVAHSLYKAHAFLSSGSVVDIARASWVPDKAAPRPTDVLASLGVALALYLGVGWAAGAMAAPTAPVLALGAILVMGLTMLLAPALAGQRRTYVIGRTVAAAAAVAVAYFTLHAGAAALFAGLLPPLRPDATAIAAALLAVASFAAVAVLQILEPSRAASPPWRAARVHIANGLYVNAVFDRLVGAMRRPAISSN